MTKTDLEVTEDNMTDMVECLTELARAEYGEYENINGVKVIDVHEFMHWLSAWADLGMSHEVERLMTLLDIMNEANLMLGRLEFPTLVREGSGIRYGALKIDLYKRIEKAQAAKVTSNHKDRDQAWMMIDKLMDKIHEVGSY